MSKIWDYTVPIVMPQPIMKPILYSMRLSDEQYVMSKCTWGDKTIRLHSTVMLSMVMGYFTQGQAIRLTSGHQEMINSGLLIHSYIRNI